MRRLGATLLGSVIAAAFIGPGTVSAAASAGASFGWALLWALTFSTVACLVLQEAAARLTVVTGRDLGQALRHGAASAWSRAVTLVLVLGAIVLGCAAYEAGNILGGVAGAALSLPLSGTTLASLTVLVAAALLGFNSPRRVATWLSALVAVMGLAFLTTAVLLRPPVVELLRGALVPAMPAGSGLLALALVGTTVVPYNLFLGSRMAAGQDLGDLRFGLAVAIVLGGAISMAVLVVGSATAPPLRFEELARVLAERLGGWARGLFSVGLFAAGLSSAVTAPLAAAITARSLLAGGSGEGWSDRGWRFRGIWMGVLAVGWGVGVSGLQPIPIIILAQALNGVVLPVAAVFLLLAVNDHRVMGERVNGALPNLALAPVTGVTVLLGVSGVARAVARGLGEPEPSGRALLAMAVGASLLLAWPVARRMRAGRRQLPGA